VICENQETSSFATKLEDIKQCFPNNGVEVLLYLFFISLGKTARESEIKKYDEKVVGAC
jgi:hypothetical protein